MKNSITSAVTRLILLFITGINLYLEAKGYPAIDLDEGLITETVNGIFVIGYAVYVWYRNSNITKEAQKSQEYLDELKNK